MRTPAVHDRLKPSLLDRLIGTSDPASSTATFTHDARDMPEAQGSRVSAAAVVNRRQLRASVARDLIWLLNATRLEAPADDDPWIDAAAQRPAAGPDTRGALSRSAWRDAPLARASVLNFGLPAMTGRAQSSLDRRRLQRDLVEAIHRFEPRLVPESLEVSIDDGVGSGINGTGTGNGGGGSGGRLPRGAHRPLRLVIQGQLRHDPVPLTLWMAAELDLDTGHARLRDLRG
ncbi:type VI secretion system baseplate subunit TssE [Roseateles noduli]|uniref:type VI secretion system baseplate subunit TssE n=1 Tax=Roseateles noduli TaxID=2052484 RepID=UPI003D650551